MDDYVSQFTFALCFSKVASLALLLANNALPEAFVCLKQIDVTTAAISPWQHVGKATGR